MNLLLLLVTTFYHSRLMANPVAYRNSVVIFVEFSSYVIAIVFFLVNLWIVILGALIPRYRQALAAIVVCILTAATMIVAIWIDYPTLLYAT